MRNLVSKSAKNCQITKGEAIKIALSSVLTMGILLFGAVALSTDLSVSKVSAASFVTPFSSPIKTGKFQISGPKCFDTENPNTFVVSGFDQGSNNLPNIVAYKGKKVKDPMRFVSVCNDGNCSCANGVCSTSFVNENLLESGFEEEGQITFVSYQTTNNWMTTKKSNTITLEIGCPSNDKGFNDWGLPNDPYASAYTKYKSGIVTYGSYGQITIKDADAKTFKALEYGYAKDAKNVYYHATRIAGNLNPQSFEVIYKKLAKDNSKLIYAGKIVEGIDSTSMTVFNKSFQTTFVSDSQVYCFDTFSDSPILLPFAQASTFRVNGSTGYDSRATYYGCWMYRETETGRTLTRRGLNYGSDLKNIYTTDSMPAKLVVGADASTFEPIWGCNGNSKFGKDSSSVFWNGKYISGADVDSFELINSDANKLCNLAKDRNFVYFTNQVLSDLDVNSVSIVGEKYIKDADFVYYVPLDSNRGYATLMSNGPKSFQVLSTNFAKDMTNFFYKDAKIEGLLGSKTFKKLSSSDLRKGDQQRLLRTEMGLFEIGVNEAEGTDGSNLLSAGARKISR